MKYLLVFALIFSISLIALAFNLPVIPKSADVDRIILNNAIGEADMIYIPNETAEEWSSNSFLKGLLVGILASINIAVLFVAFHHDKRKT